MNLPSRDTYQRIDFLDQMRAVSIISVMLNHFNSTYFPGGGVGVGVFFALSGFLIATKLFKIQRTLAEMFSFIIQRVFRVFPLLLIMIFIVFVLMPFVHPEWFNLFKTSIFKIALLSDGPEKWVGLSIGVLWTLRVEIVFYISLPIFLLILGKQRGILIYSFILLASYNSENIRSFLGHIFPISSFFLLWGGALVLGSLLALALEIDIVEKVRLVEWRYIGKIFALSAVVIYFILLWFPPTPAENWHIQILIASVCGCLWIAANDIQPLPVLPGMPFIGRISFSMYLLHGVVLDYVPGLIGGLQQRYWIFLFFILVVSMSFLTYKYIEQPGISIGRRLANMIKNIGSPPKGIA